VQNAAPGKESGFGGFVKQVHRGLRGEEEGEHARPRSERGIRQAFPEGDPDAARREREREARGDCEQRVLRAQLDRRTQREADLHRLPHDDDGGARGERESKRRAAARRAAGLRQRRVRSDAADEPHRQQQRDAGQRRFPRRLPVASLEGVGDGERGRHGRRDPQTQARHRVRRSGAAEPRQGERYWKEGLQPLGNRAGQ
jgi:hypothetical protein